MIGGVAVKLGVEWEDERRVQCTEERIGKGTYRVIRLPNKLEALLVHDPDTDKASAAVNVNVGNFLAYHLHRRNCQH
jgi:secreted Zn-dependent insulinase-like peptidase